MGLIDLEGRQDGAVHSGGKGRRPSRIKDVGVKRKTAPVVGAVSIVALGVITDIG
jgi:hypothetical protein